MAKAAWELGNARWPEASRYRRYTPSSTLAAHSLRDDQVPLARLARGPGVQRVSYCVGAESFTGPAGF